MGSEMQVFNERGREFAFIQEAAPPFERVAERPANSAWCCVRIAIRKRWDIREDDKWLALLLATKSDGHIYAKRRATHWWRHPGGNIIAKRMDTIYTKGNGWRSRQLRRGRSDHAAVALVRGGRKAEAWTAAVSDRPPIAKEKGWTPQTTSERECVRALLTRSLVGAEGCADIQRGLEATARAVQVVRESPDDLFDDPGEEPQRLRAKRKELTRRASRAEGTARDRFGRLAWRAGLRITHMRARMRMAQALESRWCRVTGQEAASRKRPGVGSHQAAVGSCLPAGGHQQAASGGQ